MRPVRKVKRHKLTAIRRKAMVTLRSLFNLGSNKLNRNTNRNINNPKRATLRPNRLRHHLRV
jgi:hypothetical protein